MIISYSTTGFNGDTRSEVHEDVALWIKNHLRSDSMEHRLARIEAAAAMIAADWLKRNPEKLEELADTIECYGFDFKVSEKI